MGVMVVETVAKHLLLLRRWDGPARLIMLCNITECKGTRRMAFRRL